jgi:hypothetical protein
MKSEISEQTLGRMLARKWARFCIVNSAKFVYAPPVEPGLGQALHAAS